MKENTFHQTPTSFTPTEFLEIARTACRADPAGFAPVGLILTSIPSAQRYLSSVAAHQSACYRLDPANTPNLCVCFLSYAEVLAHHLASGLRPHLVDFVASAVERLIRAGVVAIALDSELLYGLETELAQRYPHLRFICLGDVLSQLLREGRSRRVALIGSSPIYAASSFHAQLTASGAELILPLPEEQSRLNHFIESVRSEQQRRSARKYLADLCLRLSLEEEVDHIILAHHLLESLLPRRSQQVLYDGLGNVPRPVFLSASDVHAGAITDYYVQREGDYHEKMA